MAYTALKLITKAYYLSQIVSRELQSVSGDQIADGLDLLNALLEIKGSDLRLIPYYRRYTFPTVNGQEEYFIADLLSIDAITFNIGSVRYPMQDMTRFEYFGTARVDGITNLPFSYRAERELGGMRIYMYFLPGGVYDVKLSGKFALSEVTLEQDLSLTYDLYYIEYLRYALAEYICCEYGNTFPDECKAKYMEIRKKLMDTSPPDLSIQKMSYFQNQFVIDWQTVNLSVGYLPF